MKRLVTTALATLLLGGPALAQDDRVGVEPFLSPLGDSQTLEDGADIYQYWCAACHLPGKPGSVAVMMLHGEQVPTDLPGRETLDPFYVEYLVRNGQAAMPHFRKTQISDTQLTALAEYLAAPAE